MIRLLPIFIIFVFLFLPTCYNFGNMILKRLKINLNKYLTIFVGILGVIALFQIAFYPALTLQLSSLYLTVTGSVIVLGLIILDIKNIKSFKEIWCDKKILIMLLITGIIFFIYMRTTPNEIWYFDDSFYLPFMYENANTSKLLSIEPRTGDVIDKINSLYASQGYYMIGSYLISIFNLVKDFFSLKITYLAIVYYFMAFPSFFAFILACVGMAKEITNEKWKKVLFISLFVFFAVFLPIDSNLLNNMIMTGYVGPFVSLTIYVPFILFCLIKYFNGNRKYAPLLAISFVTILSIASFNIFLILVLLYTLLFMQYVFKKKMYLNDYVLMALPELIFLINFVISSNIISFVLQIAVVIFYLLFVKFNSVFLKLEEKTFHILKYIVYILPIIFFVSSILMIVFDFKIECSFVQYMTTVINTIFPLFGTESYHYSKIFITLFYLAFLFIFLFVMRKNNDTKKQLCTYLLIVCLTFLNPFTIQFVSTYITSETYNRLFVIILNPIVFYFVISIAVENINWNKFKRISKDTAVIGISILLALTATLIQLKEFNYWVVITGRSDKLYRMRERDVAAVNLLNRFVIDYEIDKVNLASTHSELKVANPEIHSLYDRTVVFEPNKDFTKKAYYISVLYNLNKGVIKQEYYQRYYADNIMEVFDYLDVNFVTIDVNCPNVKYNYTSNVLCETPIKDEKSLFIYEEERLDYKEDIEIYNELKKHLVLVYQTDRYRLYYVDRGDMFESQNTETDR